MILRVGQAIIDCFEAHSPAEHSVGLSETESLEDGQGMLFVYPKEMYHSFWMPGTMKFPIDILFIHGNDAIGRIHEHCEPGAKERFIGKGMHVLEVPAGFCAKAGIKKGDKIHLEEEAELEASTSSDLLRTLSTASLKISQISQSTESAPYSRVPSKAPSAPTERFMDHDTFDNQIPEGGTGVTNGPIHDESWNSPTRS